MANAITAIRMLCSIALLFCPLFSPAFYLLYVIAGFSDMIDGTVARKTGTASGLGSMLDTAADFLFLVICVIKLLPELALETWILIWMGLIFIIKLMNIVSGLIIRRKIVPVHSVMNKLTGALLFALPLSISVIEKRYSAAVVCAAATVAAIQEGHCIRTGKNEKNE